MGRSRHRRAVSDRAVALISAWHRAICGWSRCVESPRSVLVACALTFAVHLLFLSRDLSSDEGGFAMVARGWRSAGPYLYGHQWVDRPPGLLLVFEVADGLGPFGVRLMAGACATILVAAAGWSAWVLGGWRAAGWTAWAAFGWAVSPFLDADQLDGEIIAAPLVMLSVAALLHALHRRRSATGVAWFGLVAGAASTSALLVKQNFADALLFADVFLLAAAVTGRLPRPRIVWTAAGFVVGAVLPVAGALTWAASRTGVAALVYAVYGFRADAGEVMAGWSWHAPGNRLVQLFGLAAVSGLLLVAVQLPWAHSRRLPMRSPTVWALTATTGFGMLGIALGGNYWPHYLIELVPMLALAAGLGCVTAARARRWTRLLVTLVALSGVVVAPTAAVLMHARRTESSSVARWLAGSARHHDTVVVPFTHANVIEMSGLSSPYPYSWSLPVRVLDPHLRLLASTLAKKQTAPTWVVRWDAPHTWGLDPRGRVALVLETDYREVAVVCGHPVWLHRGVHRSIAQAPDGCLRAAGAPR